MKRTSKRENGALNDCAYTNFVKRSRFKRTTVHEFYPHLRKTFLSTKFGNEDHNSQLKSE